jgi:hypothetical protein
MVVRLIGHPPREPDPLSLIHYLSWHTIHYYATLYTPAHTPTQIAHTHTHPPQVAAQLGRADVAVEFAALATRMHASLDALYWDAQTGAYADFYVADNDAIKAEPAAAAAAASASAPASSKPQASESTTGATTTTTGAGSSAPVSSASSSSPSKHFVRHAGYVALFPLLLRLVRASDSTRLHALLGTRCPQMTQSWHRQLRLF